MPQIVIRQATGEQDIATVRRLMREYSEHLASNRSGAASICLTNYESELAKLPEGYLTILLAEVDGASAGCVAIRQIIRTERACEMKRLWVGNGFRGLGLGRSLIERSLAWATEAGFEAMYLDTVPAAMPEANRLYASYGFVPVDRYNDNDVAGVQFFCKSLKDKNV
ncbi:GNAT family N-acetyltransferase [Edaphobacter aggregans]|uniref:GNAT family N-acetyltransferase n=1 Tax=Edaphobacter aggregans TaxID=570835 RepID=UPI0005545B8E|nr:GNAT family N-acetyltransferase [Edaphobacter aggregans]